MDLAATTEYGVSEGLVALASCCASFAIAALHTALTLMRATCEAACDPKLCSLFSSRCTRAGSACIQCSTLPSSELLEQRYLTLLAPHSKLLQAAHPLFGADALLTASCS